jgi:predicted porin
MAYHGFSGIASTTTGSVYGIGTGSAMIAAAPGGSFERNSNLIQYTTPSMSGLTANVSIGQNSTDVSTTAGKTETTQQGLSVSYAAGPLSAGVGMNTREIGAEGASATASGAKVEADLNWVGASYNLGVAVVSVANVTREDSDIAAVTGVKTKARDVSVTSLGVTVPMGAMTFNVGMYDGEDKGGASATDNTDMSGYQASVRYALSKRTTVYALIGENEIKRKNVAGASKTTSGNMIGLMHTF